MIIDISNPMIHYSKEDKTFSAELSDLEKVRGEITKLCRQGSPIYLKNPKTGNQVKTTRFKVDSDGEEDYGWWYRGKFNGKSFEFLFIND